MPTTQQQVETPPWIPGIHHTWNRKQIDAWCREYGPAGWNGGHRWYIRSKRIANSSYFDVWFTLDRP